MEIQEDILYIYLYKIQIYIIKSNTRNKRTQFIHIHSTYMDHHHVLFCYILHTLNLQETCYIMISILFGYKSPIYDICYFVLVIFEYTYFCNLLRHVYANNYQGQGYGFWLFFWRMSLCQLLIYVECKTFFQYFNVLCFTNAYLLHSTLLSCFFFSPQKLAFRLFVF